MSLLARILGKYKSVQAKSDVLTDRKAAKKLIWHVGAWAGNFGDSIIQRSLAENLKAVSRYDLEFRYINCQQTEFTEELIAELNQEADLLLLGGGGLIFFRPQDKSRSGWQFNIDIGLIDDIKVPFVVHGIGYNRFEFDQSDFLPVTNEHLKKTVEKADLFSVRNSGTREELVKRGCDGEKIEVVPDSGIFSSAEPVRIPGFVEGRLKVGVNWTSDREEQAFPEPFAENKARFISSLIGLCRHLVAQRNAQIFFIGHMGPGFDAGIIGELRAGLGTDLVVIDEALSALYPAGYDNAIKLAGIYSQMDLVLGMRGHSNLVAFGQHVPFIPIGSHRKNRYFISDIGEDKYLIDARTPSRCSEEAMITTVCALLDEKDAYMERHREVFGRFRERFDDFNRRALALLDKSFEVCPLCGGESSFYTRTNRYNIYRDVVICRKCELIYLSPLVRSNEYDRLYNDDYRKLYECPSVPDEAFHKERTPASMYRIDLIKKTAGLSRETELLDVGCGGGTFLIHLKSAGFERIAGIELEPRYSSYVAGEGINVMKERVEDLVATARYDVITMWHVLEHVEDPLKALEAARRLLKDGGSLFVEVPLIFDVDNPPKDKVTFQIAHNYYFTRKSLSSVLERAGFAIMESEVTPMNFYVVRCRKN